MYALQICVALLGASTVMGLRLTGKSTQKLSGDAADDVKSVDDVVGVSKDANRGNGWVGEIIQESVPPEDTPQGSPEDQ